MKHKGSSDCPDDSLNDVDASAIFSRTSSEAGSFVMSSMAKKRPVTSKYIRTRPDMPGSKGRFRDDMGTFCLSAVSSNLSL